MELINYNEIYGDFSILKTKGDINEAVIVEASDYISKRLKLNYKDLYEDNLFFQVLANTPEEGHSCPGCDDCLGDNLILKCNMCEDPICPAPRSVYSINQDKLATSEVKIPICQDCYEKHKLLPIGTVTSFIGDALKTYITNLSTNIGKSYNEIELFLVC